MKYDDIINLPRPELKHTRMSPDKRAAQFSPFAALGGFYDKISLSGSEQCEKVTFMDDALDIINSKLIFLSYVKNAVVSVKYFSLEFNNQGIYKSVQGSLNEVNIEKNFILINDVKIIFEDIYDIDITSFLL